MSLDISKLRKVRTCGAKITAQCPACAESGHDRTSDHLVINDDGAFACVVYPGDSPDAKAHRKRVFALCGIRDAMALSLHPVQASSAKPIKTGILGRLGRAFKSHARESGWRNNEQPQDRFPFGSRRDYERGVPSVPKIQRMNNTVKPYRPLTEFEQGVLRRAGLEDDPMIIEALNIFEGRIVG